MNDRSEKLLIIGFSTNQDPARVSIFANSLRKIYSPDTCDVVLAINQPEVFEVCRQFKIYPFPALGDYTKSQDLRERGGKYFVGKSLSAFIALGGQSPYLRGALNAHFEATLHPHLARWFFYQRVLDTFPNTQKVLITDVSDVFFQAPFFENFHEDRLHFFSETDNYGNSKWNDDNYSRLYGQKEHDEIRDKPILCMGVWGGNANLAKQMIKWMVHSVYEQPKGGSDQVRGNRFRHLNRSNGELEVHNNGSSSVLHIHKAELLGDSDSTIAYVRGNRIAAKQDDSVIPIIHMYNRHPHALEIANHLRSE